MAPSPTRSGRAAWPALVVLLALSPWAGAGEPPTGPAPSPDERLSPENAPRIETLRVIEAHPGTWARSVAYDRSGRSIASGGPDRRLVLWDADTGERRFELRGHG